MTRFFWGWGLVGVSLFMQIKDLWVSLQIIFEDDRVIELGSVALLELQ